MVWSADVVVKIGTQYDDSGVKKMRQDIRSLARDISKGMPSGGRYDTGLPFGGGSLPNKLSGQIAQDRLSRTMEGIPRIGYMGKAGKQGVLDNMMQKNRQNMLFLGLSVMFAGMAVQRAMEGILQPAMELSGIFEIISAILTILFLPAVLLLIPVLLKVLEWVSGMDEKTKLLIGVLAMAFLALGAFAAVIGQILTLLAGLTGLSSVVSTLSAAGGAGSLAGLALAFGAFIASVGIWVALMEGYDKRLREKPSTASALSSVEQALPLGAGKATAELRSAGIEAASAAGISDAQMAAFLSAFPLTAPFVNLGKMLGGDVSPDYFAAQEAAMRAGVSREDFIKYGYLKNENTGEYFFNVNLWNNVNMNDVKGTAQVSTTMEELRQKGFRVA